MAHIPFNSNADSSSNAGRGDSSRDGSAVDVSREEGTAQAMPEADIVLVLPAEHESPSPAQASPPAALAETCPVAPAAQ